MSGSSSQQRPGLELGELAAMVAVAAALIGAQAVFLVTLVGRPLERAVVAAREPAPAMVLVRVPEYFEEIEVVGPPRWQRDLARAEASRRGGLLWFAGVQGDEASLMCPATR